MHVPKEVRIPGFGGLAQLGERLPCKQEVTGSIPVLSTKRSRTGQQLSWLEHTTDNREVDGSSPFWPTTSNKMKWGFSSAGRAPALQAGGQRFDPANLHHIKKLTEVARKRYFIEFLNKEIQLHLEN